MFKHDCESVAYITAVVTRLKSSFNKRGLHKLFLLRRHGNRFANVRKCLLQTVQ